MIGNLRITLMAMLAVMGLTVQAQGVTFDFDNDYATLFPTLAGTSSGDSHDGDFTAATTSTAVGGFTVTVSAADEGVSNANRIWSGAPRLRMYSGTLTIKGSGIKKIEFTGHNTNFNLATATGKLDGKTWTGEADEVVFSVAKNTQINKLVINGDTEPEPTPGETTVVDATCAEIIAGADGTTYRVTGACTEIKQTTYGNWTLKDDTGEVLIYGTLDAQGNTKNFSSLGIEVGDIVTVVGPKKTFNTTIELTDVTVEKIVKGSHTPEPEPTVTEVSVAQALSIIDGLDNGASTSEEYQVQGYVVSISEISTNFGNATFIIADEQNAESGLTVFRAKGFNNENITTEDFIKVGDSVVLQGKLQKYVKNDAVTPELSNCYFLKVNNTANVNSAMIVDNEQAPAYNLAGQQVVTGYRGLIIKGGKKILKK